MAKLGARIRKLREAAGLSQERVAELLGISRPAVSQIENDERKICAEELQKLAKTFNISVDRLLSPEREAAVIIRENRMQYARAVVGEQVRINVPKKNFEKFKEVFLYILNRVGSKPNIGETVIYKLLYFIDFDYYEKYEEQLIGATYVKNLYGPTPLEFKKIVERMIREKEIDKIISKYFEYPQTKYLPLRKPDLSKLSASEIAVVDEILNRLSDMNANQISEYSHNDVPWLTTEENETIEYESVFYRTPPYSVREYGDEIQ